MKFNKVINEINVELKPSKQGEVPDYGYGQVGVGNNLSNWAEVKNKDPNFLLILKYLYNNHKDIYQQIGGADQSPFNITQNPNWKKGAWDIISTAGGIYQVNDESGKIVLKLSIRNGKVEEEELRRPWAKE